MRAHRVAYMLAYGEVDDSLCVCHSCDNPSCCNPRHLWQGTRSDNMQDMVRKGRLKPTIRYGEESPAAKLTSEQVLEIRARHAAGGVIGATLADEYGVSRSLISLILRRKRWPHLEGEENAGRVDGEKRLA